MFLFGNIPSLDPAVKVLLDAIRRYPVDESVICSTIRRDPKVIYPLAGSEALIVWYAAMICKETRIAQMMLDALVGHSVDVGELLTVAVHFNRSDIFQSLLELFPVTDAQLAVAIGKARSQGQVEILRTALELGVSRDVLLSKFRSWLTKLENHGAKPASRWRMHRQVLSFYLEHNLIDSETFQSFSPILGDNAQCEQMVHECLDCLGFDPHGCDIANATKSILERSVWWRYNRLRTWSLTDCPVQSLISLMISLSTILSGLKSSVSTRKAQMWAWVEDIFRCRDDVFTTSAGHPNSSCLLFQLLQDGHIELLLRCWPILTAKVEEEQEEEEEENVEQADWSDPMDDVSFPRSHSARGWLRFLQQHPVIQIILTCQAGGDLIGTFKQVLRTLQNDPKKQMIVGPSTLYFSDIYSSSLTWALSMSQELAEQVYAALKQAVEEECGGNRGLLFNAISAARSHSYNQDPVLKHLSFHEKRFLELFPNRYESQIRQKMDSLFDLIVRKKEELAALQYFVSDERLRGCTARVSADRLMSSMVHVLEQRTSSAMDKFRWLVQYTIDTYGVQALKELGPVRRSRILRSGYMDAVQLLKQHGAVFSIEQGRHVDLFGIACKSGDLVLAKVIADDAYEQDGAQGLLDLITQSSKPDRMYNAFDAARVYGQVHIESWLHELAARASAMISSGV